jgi:hypothetical protein
MRVRIEKLLVVGCDVQPGDLGLLFMNQAQRAKAG